MKTIFLLFADIIKIKIFFLC